MNTQEAPRSKNIVRRVVESVVSPEVVIPTSVAAAGVNLVRYMSDPASGIASAGVREKLAQNPDRFLEGFMAFLVIAGSRAGISMFSEYRQARTNRNNS